MTEDDAVVGLVPGATPSRMVMILAGTTTFGTQGAVEFVSRPDSVGKLLQQIPGSATETKPFEALLRGECLWIPNWSPNARAEVRIFSASGSPCIAEFSACCSSDHLGICSRGLIQTMLKAGSYCTRRSIRRQIPH
jgi:hypothetical protein